MIKTIFLIISILLLNIQTSYAESIALTINDKIITQSDIDNIAKIILFEAKIEINDENIKKFNSLAKSYFIKSFAQKSITRRYGIEINDMMIDRYIQKTAQQKGMAIDQYYRRYYKVGIPIKTIFEKKQVELVWNLYVNEFLIKSTSIPQADINKYINTIKDKKLRNISIISITWKDNKSQAKQTIKDIVKRINNGTPFYTMAKIFSSDITALDGGMLGWVSKGEQPKKLDLITWAIPVGTISNIIEINKNFIVIKINDEKTESGNDTKTLTQQYIKKVVLEKSAQSVEHEIKQLDIQHK